MKIVMTASEAVPFAQSGGLGEVVSNLCRALGALGHEVTLIVPHYPQLNAAKPETLELAAATLSIPIGSRQVAGRVWESQLPASNVRVLLVEQRGYYDRPFLYHDGQRDFRDNCERFIYLSRAVPEIIRQFDLQPDVIHAHDWQTGLVPALLATEYRTVPACEHAVSVFTLHNLAYQGTFWHWDMLLTGLDWKYFNWRQMEFFGNLNLLKTGIVFADALTTVSPTYAEEIQTPEFGCGLHGVLRSRGAEITGILHGVDVKTWNPATDPYLPHNYSTENVVAGKAACKTALQRRLGLPERQVTPLAGMVAPLTDQNGFELLVARVDRILADDVQLVFLGDGDSTYRNWLNELAARNGTKVSASFGADDQLFHQIEAGADLYLMPSRFEPCGLNQMRSLIYGTVPVVRATGGLADTVVDATPDSISNQTANGFAFRDYDAKAFGDTMQRALDLYQDQPAWLDVVQTGMRGDWSWQRSAGEYVRVYEQTLARVGSGRTLAGSRR